MNTGLRRLFTGVLAAALVAAALVGCTPSGPITTGIGLDVRDHELWDSTVGEFLTDDLWDDRNAYDAGHLLMAPLEAAFVTGEHAWQEAFANQFDLFVQESSKPDNSVTKQKLSRLQYYYLASSFLSHAATADDSELVPLGLDKILLDELEDTWLEYEAWQWDSPSFRGMRDRLEWKLSTKNVEKSYYRAIIDEELFTLAIASEYRAYESEALPKDSWSPIVSDILEVTEKIVGQEAISTDGGWLFQTGVWEDHPDYEYAGLAEPLSAMQPTPRDNVATDSSHASRWPLWLRSFRDASEESSKRYKRYDHDLNLLSNQFIDQILVTPSSDFPYMRMNNYMDGWNGLFRWGYETVGADSGYGPYELSGSLLVIWWGMLPDARVASAYCELSRSFPLSDEAITLYVGPNTTRERNPLVTWPDYFTNGFAELNSRLMCKLGQD